MSLSQGRTGFCQNPPGTKTPNKYSRKLQIFVSGTGPQYIVPWWRRGVFRRQILQGVSKCVILDSTTHTSIINSIIDSSFLIVIWPQDKDAHLVRLICRHRVKSFTATSTRGFVVFLFPIINLVRYLPKEISDLSSVNSIGRQVDLRRNQWHLPP